MAVWNLRRTGSIGTVEPVGEGYCKCVCEKREGLKGEMGRSEKKRGENEGEERTKEGTMSECFTSKVKKDGEDVVPWEYYE